MSITTNRIFSCILLYVLCGSMFCFAQDTIKGRVVDEKNQPVKMANVILYPDSLGKQPMESFAVTDKQGAFSLTTPDGFDGWLFVRCMGFEDYVEKLFNDKKSYLVMLFDKAREIQEVLVKGNYSGVKTKGDSVIFDVKHFSTGAEENISDVLRRLPGMEVSETGKVKFEGKDVDKILVNGNDVMTTGSGMMLNGLSADVVEGAEILRNWSDGSLAHSLRSGEQQMALNIKTSDSFRYSGKIDGGGGIVDKYEAKSTAMFIGKRGSLTAALSSNNLGKEIISMDDYIGSFVDLKGLSSNGVSQLEFSEEERALMNPPTNVYRNTNSALILNGGYNVTNNLEAKVGVLLNKADMNSFDRNSSIYFHPYLATDNEDSKDKSNETESFNIRLKWRPATYIELQSSTLGKWSNYTTNQSIGYLGMNNMQIEEKDMMKNYDVMQSLQVTGKVGKTTLYSLASFGTKTQNEDLNVLNDSLLLPTYFAYDNGRYGITSYNSGKSTSWGVEVGSKWAIFKGYNLALAVRNDYIKDKFALDDSYTTNSNVIGAYNKLSGSLVFEKTTGLVRFSANASLTGNSYDLSEKEINDKSLRLNFNSLLRFVFNPKSELIFTGSRETSQTDINHMVGFPIHLSYNRVQNASVDVSPFVNNDMFSFTYRLRSSYHNIIFYLLGIYYDTDGGGLANISQQGLANNITYKNGGREKLLSLNSVLSKGLGHYPADVKIKMSWSNSCIASSLNDVLFNNTIQSPKAELSLSTRMKSIFNYEIGTIYKGTKYISYADYTQKTNLWSAYAYTYLATGNFKGTLKYEFSNIHGDKQSRVNHNVGFSFSYNIKPFLLTLSGEELLHLNNNEWMSVSSSSYSSTVSYYKKMPGYLLLSASWNFD